MAFFKGLVYKFKVRAFKKEWRRRNNHNFTIIGEYNFPINNVAVGNLTYGTLNVHSLWERENEKLIIQNRVSIAPGVQFLLGGDHQMKTLTTYPIQSMLEQKSPKDALCKGPIIIEDDVWIGTNAIILSNVKVGKGAVVAAGSVVTKDVPPFAIIGGNPGRIIKYRFSEEVIQILKDIDLNQLTNKDFLEKRDILYNEISSIGQAIQLKKLFQKNA